jgi:A/G-specific adenine glycosylase
MLQQTTVAAVVPYFERFLTAFPTVVDLANADEQQVLKLWEGLGYYRRARHLHATARLIVEQHGGRFPADPDLVAEFPGIGRYILGAVMSQAFEQRLPIVEANSQRVLARLHGYRGDPREGAGKTWVWDAAEVTLPQKRVGDFNQALMELGALVCTEQPKCDQCPWSKACVANRDSLQMLIPPPKKKPAVVPVREVALAISRGSKILVCRRPANAPRWSNMWELPHAELLANEKPKAGSLRIAAELLNLKIADVCDLARLTHRVTRFEITITALTVRHISGRFRSSFYSDAAWVKLDQLSDYPTSTPQRKLMRLLLAQHTPRASR